MVQMRPWFRVAMGLPVWNSLMVGMTPKAAFRKLTLQNITREGSETLIGIRGCPSSQLPCYPCLLKLCGFF